MEQSRNIGFDLQISIFGVSHRTADARVRDLLARAAFSQSLCGWQKMLPHGSGLILLSTCNRTEWIISADSFSNKNNAFDQFSWNWLKLSGLSKEEYDAAVYTLEGLPALEHVYRVASSLDSMVPGEPQILGQLKTSLHEADERGTLNPNLTGLLQDAIRTSKKVRRETRIGAGSLSVAAMAAKILSEKSAFGDLLMIGTGKTAKLFLRNWSKYTSLTGRDENQKIYVTGRNPTKARELAREFDGIDVPWDGFEHRVPKCTRVVGAVSVNEPVLTFEMLDRVWDHHKDKDQVVNFLDLSIPRSIDSKCSKLKNVQMIDIDSLRAHVEKNLSGRQESLSEAEEIVLSAVRRYVRKKRIEGFGEFFQNLQEKYESFYVNELERLKSGKFSSLDQKDLTEIERIFMELKNKSLFFPMTALKEWGLRSGVTNVIEIMESHLENFEHLEKDMYTPLEKSEPHSEPRQPFFGG